MKKNSSTSKLASVVGAKANINDPGIVLFQGPKSLLKAGAVELQSFSGVADKIFGRSVQDVKADFDRVSGQINQMLSTAFSQTPGGLKLDTVEIALGFSAEGKLAFIAQTGVEATVTVTFKKP